MVCGDLNSEPGSDCYSLYAAGAVTHTYPVAPDQLAARAAAAGWAVSAAEAPAAGGTESFSQPLALRPAYDPQPVPALGPRLPSF